MDSNSSILKYALEECEAAHAVSAAKVERLMLSAFDNGPRACEALKTLVRQRGIEAAIRLLENDRAFGRSWYFGSTQERFLLWGSKERVNQALSELPRAIREQEELAAKLHDLRQAVRAGIEREDQDRLDRSVEPTRRPTRDRSRE